MQCETCRKQQVELTSWWERFKFKVMQKLFAKDLLDFNQEKYTQGFGDGYKKGMEHGHDQCNQSVELMNAIVKGDITPELNDLYGEVKK